MYNNTNSLTDLCKKKKNHLVSRIGLGSKSKIFFLTHQRSGLTQYIWRFRMPNAALMNWMQLHFAILHLQDWMNSLFFSLGKSPLLWLRYLN